MRLIGNLIWLIFGGVIIFIEYLIASLILCITIIGIPFGLQTLKLAHLSLWPFGKRIVQVEQSTSCLSTIMNIFWILFGGLWICITHLIFGLFFAITIVGFPFAIQHFKLAGLALTPFGRNIKY